MRKFYGRSKQQPTPPPVNKSLLTGLVSYWQLQETSAGTGAVTRNDSVGTNHLTDNNTTASGAGVFRNCIHTVGADDTSLSCASNATLQTGDIDFTFAAWWYPVVNDDFIAVVRKVSGAAYEYLLCSGAGNKACAFLGTLGILISDDAVTAGVWNLVIMYHDSTADLLGLQINNGAVKTKDTTGIAPIPSASAFFLGLADATAESYIDEVGFWKRLLTTDEKTALYNSGGGLTYPFLVGGEPVVTEDVSPHPTPTTIYVSGS